MLAKPKQKNGLSSLDFTDELSENDWAARVPCVCHIGIEVGVCEKYDSFLSDNIIFYGDSTLWF